MASQSSRGQASRSLLPGGYGPGRRTRDAPTHGPLPPWPRSPVSPDEIAGAGAFRIVYRGRDVRRHGDGFVADSGAGDACASELMHLCTELCFESTIESVDEVFCWCSAPHVEKLQERARYGRFSANSLFLTNDDQVSDCWTYYDPHRKLISSEIMMSHVYPAAQYTTYPEI